MSAIVGEYARSCKVLNSFKIYVGKGNQSICNYDAIIANSSLSLESFEDDSDIEEFMNDSLHNI